MSDLLEETRFLMKKYHIKANKSLGQNFLISNEVVEKIVDCSNISKDDLVIEIGPGLGTLTKELLEKAGKVVAIELDKKMLSILKDRFSLYHNFSLINKDVLKVDLNKLITLAYIISIVISYPHCQCARKCLILICEARLKKYPVK